MQKSTRLISLVAILVLAFAAGCGDDPLAPFEPEITNLPDTFEMQATGVEKISTTLTYDWSNSGSQADLDQSTTTSSGSATLIIHDSQDQLIHQAELKPSGSLATAAGSPGTWRVQVVLIDYSGTLNFSLEKR